MSESKKCNCCGIIKPLSEYCKYPKSKDKRAYNCKGCTKEKYKNRSEAVKQKEREKSKVNYYKDACKSRVYHREYNKEYHKRVKRKTVIYGIDWYYFNNLKTKVRKYYNQNKSDELKAIVGCDLRTFKKYLGKEFLDCGEYLGLVSNVRHLHYTNWAIKNKYKPCP